KQGETEMIKRMMSMTAAVLTLAGMTVLPTFAQDKMSGDKMSHGKMSASKDKKTGKTATGKTSQQKHSGNKMHGDKMSGNKTHSKMKPPSRLDFSLTETASSDRPHRVCCMDAAGIPEEAVSQRHDEAWMQP